MFRSPAQAAALAVAALISCGGETPRTATPCMSDRECRGDRICHEGRCRFTDEVRAHAQGRGVDSGRPGIDAGPGATTVQREQTRELPMFMGGPRHTGRSINAGPPAEPSRRWIHRTGARIFASPVLGPDGTVYVGSLDRSFHAI